MTLGECEQILCADLFTEARMNQDDDDGPKGAFHTLIAMYQTRLVSFYHLEIGSAIRQVVSEGYAQWLAGRMHSFFEIL